MGEGVSFLILKPNIRKEGTIVIRGVTGEPKP